ncbi:MAG: hypothetical protein JNL96_03775 [Planctomycetaceae bacterium]|nr:hypothetical protein [Planctomycetaceae bacterium]
MSATNLTNEPTTAAATIEGLAGRVAALERSARRWRAAAGAVALLAVVVVGMGAAGDGDSGAGMANTVKARAFIVVDDEGNATGVFGTTKTGASIKCQAVWAKSIEATNNDGKTIAILGQSESDDSSAILELRSNGMASILEGGSDKVEVVKE